MGTRSWLQRGLPWAVPAVVLIVWEIASKSGWLSTRVLPEPASVVTAFWGLLASGELWHHVAVSSGRALAGLAVGGGLGLALGLLTGTFRVAETLLDTSLQMVRNIPALALIPLVILWFGIDESAKLFLVAVGVFFPIYLNTFHGIRLHVIVRETEDEAWRAAAELVSHLDPKTVEAAQKKFAQMDSVGQRRMAELHKGRFNPKNVREGLEVSPNLWAGVGLVRGGAGTALVGSPEQVAERIKEYAALGLKYFILSGYPHLEEAHRFAELVFPLLPLEPQQALPQRTLTGPFGEIVANTYVPKVARS